LLQKILENVASSPSGELTLGKKLGEYILMERLFPPQQRAILLRSGLVEGSGDSISELGCFGTIVVAPDGTVQHNQYAGFLLRTKFSNVDEGGVNAGFATLSSPYLC
jgi:glutathione synthase